MRTCCRCKTALPLSEFYKHAGKRDGLSLECKHCIKSRAVSWHANNRERHNERMRSAYARDVAGRAEQSAEYYRANAEAIKASVRAWRSNNRNKKNLYEASRKAAKKQAIPSWYGEFDVFVLEEAYMLARQRASSTGIAWHVDHIVPLTSKLVCGLHCANNVAVIPASENCSKQNIHWPDMPGGVL